MLSDQHTIRIAINWMVELSALCRHAPDDRPTRSKLATLGTHLAGEFPSAAFTSEAAGHVAAAAADGWMPPYALIKTHLGEWWREHKPACAPRLPRDGEPADLGVMDRKWLELWERRRPEAEAEQRQLGDLGRLPYDRTQWPLAHLASLIRSNSPTAWRIISGDAPAPKLEPDDEAKAAVRAVVASLAVTPEPVRGRRAA